MSGWQAQKSPARGRAFGFLVAGACFALFRQRIRASVSDRTGNSNEPPDRLPLDPVFELMPTQISDSQSFFSCQVPAFD
jgi:hypothetical protein